MLVTRHLTAAQVVHADRRLLCVCAREHLKSCMGQKPELEARTFMGTSVCKVLQNYGPAASGIEVLNFVTIWRSWDPFTKTHTHTYTHDSEPHFMWWFFLSQFVFDKCEKGFGLRKDEHLKPVQSCLSEFNCHHRDSVYGNNRAHVSNVDVQGRFLSFFLALESPLGLKKMNQHHFSACTWPSLTSWNQMLKFLIYKFTNVVQLIWNTKVHVHFACCMLAARTEHGSSDHCPSFIKPLFSHEAKVRLGNIDEVEHTTQQFAQRKILKTPPEWKFLRGWAAVCLWRKSLKKG